MSLAANLNIIDNFFWQIFRFAMLLQAQFTSASKPITSCQFVYNAFSDNFVKRDSTSKMSSAIKRRFRFRKKNLKNEGLKSLRFDIFVLALLEKPL